MSCNNYRWHLHLLAEDDATKDILIGLKDSVQKMELLRQLQILPVARGFENALESIDEEMSNIENRHLLVLIDFDKQPRKRLDLIDEYLKNKPYRDRVYVIGITDEAESLKTFFGPPISLNKVGERFVESCRNGNLDTILSNAQMVHNTDTFKRLRTDVCAKLF